MCYARLIVGSPDQPAPSQCQSTSRSEPHTAPSTLAHAASACANVLSRVSNPRCRVWLRSKRCRSCRLPSNEPPRRVEGTLRPRSRQPPPGPSHELAAHFFRNLKTICELSRQRKLSRECGPPPYSKGEGFLLDSQMWMPNKNGECLPESESLAETQSTLRHTFKHMYGFILQALKGDKAAADAILRIIWLEHYPTNYCRFRSKA